MNKIAAIIVMYNSLVSKTNIIKTLDCDFIDLWFVDNSTDESIKSQNLEFCNSHQLNYLDMNGNVGLSMAYNKTIQTIKTTNKYSHVLLSDDDTLYNKEYLQELKKNIKRDVDLILPTIIDNSNNHVMSPILLSRFPLIPYKGSDKNKAPRIMGINSGTCARLNVFKEWYFDTDIFLYFTDMDFYKNNVNKNRLSYFILKTPIYQQCSGSESYSDKSINQIKLVLKDAKAFYKKQFLGIFKYYFYKLLLVLKSYKQHKQSAILKLLITKIK